VAVAVADTEKFLVRETPALTRANGRPAWTDALLVMPMLADTVQEILFEVEVVRPLVTEFVSVLVSDMFMVTLPPGVKVRGKIVAT